MPNKKEIYIVNEKRPKRLWKILLDDIENYNKTRSARCREIRVIKDFTGVSAIPDDKKDHWLIISNEYCVVFGIFET